MRSKEHIVSALIALAFMLGSASTSVGAQTPSELLERGIYNEETVGKLDRAIEIYEQIVEDATAQRPRVAEALFRIGMCRLKSNDPAAAAEAFERIIDDYADQEHFVELARGNMPEGPDNIELLPAPWRNGEVQRLSLKLTSGMEIGTLLLAVDPAQVDGVDAWRFLVRRRIYSDADNQAISEVLARRDTLAPLTSTFKHAILGHYEGVYGEEEVEITTVGADSVRTADIDGRVFDNEQSFHMFRLLPLALGYEARLKFISTPAGAANPIEVEIGAIETITVPAGEFECYRMDFGALPQTFWFSTDPNHFLVKLEASGIVGELEQTYTRDPESSIAHVDDEAGFSVTAPPGWLYAPFDDSGTPKVVLLDPGADLRAVVRLHRAPSPGSCSFQGAGMRKLDECNRGLGNFILRQKSWYEREIDGRPAVGFIGDYTEKGRDLFQHWTYVESGRYCVEFDFKGPLEKLEALRGDLDAIVAGYDGPRNPEEPDKEAAGAGDVEAVITDFHRAAAEADLDRYVQHLSPRMRFLGTDRSERYGRDELVDLAEQYFSQGIGWVAEPVEQNVFTSEDGTIAWFDEKLESARFGEMRATGVLQREDDRWRIVQYNVVLPVPNDLFPDLVAKIAEVDAAVSELPTEFSALAPLDPDDPAYEVKTALRAFHRAASEADAGRYFARVASDGVYFGTDRAERFSPEKLRAFVGPYLSAGQGWTSVPFEQHVSLSPDGRIAWFEQRIGRKGVGEMRSTGVMRKEDGEWKIVHYNQALPVPNELVEELVGKIRDFYGPG